MDDAQWRWMKVIYRARRDEIKSIKKVDIDLILKLIKFRQIYLCQIERKHRQANWVGWKSTSRELTHCAKWEINKTEFRVNWKNNNSHAVVALCIHSLTCTRKSSPWMKINSSHFDGHHRARQVENWKTLNCSVVNQCSELIRFFDFAIPLFEWVGWWYQYIDSRLK